MRSTGRHRRRATPPTDRASQSRRQALVATVAVAALTGAAVIVARGGPSIWVCVPGALLVSSLPTSRIGAVGASSAVLAAATGASMAGRPAPATPLLAVGVTAASVAVLVGLRERLERERDIARASARSDPLTGVANRRAMLERIGYEISRHARTRRGFAVLVLDLDGFKQLNDRFGHLAGDDLLREVAQAVQLAIRDQDTLARMGGDEFCVLAPETSAAGARKLAERATQAIGRVTVGIETLGASGGTALFPADGRTPVALLNAADQRLLEEKRSDREGGAARRAA